MLTLVLIDIGTSPYRKALISKIFLLNPHPCGQKSVSINYSTFTIAIYFDRSTIMAKRKTEIAASSIRVSIGYVDTMTNVDFLNYKEKSFTIANFFNHPSDIYYFIFRFNINPSSQKDNTNTNFN